MESMILDGINGSDKWYSAESMGLTFKQTRKLLATVASFVEGDAATCCRIVFRRDASEKV